MPTNGLALYQEAGHGGIFQYHEAFVEWALSSSKQEARSPRHGCMESLTPEIAPFGIRTMLVEPGFFRTELLTTDSTTFAEPAIDDYAAQTREIVAAGKSMNGKQGGDPTKLACGALVPERTWLAVHEKARSGPAARLDRSVCRRLPP